MPDEATCGDDCAEFVVEEWWEGFEARPGRRRLIGRGLHNRSVVSNVSEPTRLRTLSWLPPNATQRQHGWSGAFFGLGECCELPGCPNECEGHGGQLSIVTYAPGTFTPRVVMPLVGSSASGDKVALRMGIAVDHSYPVVDTNGTTEEHFAPRLTAWVGGRLLSWRVEYDAFTAYTQPSLIPIAVSPEVAHLEKGEEPVMMAYTYY